MLTDRFVKIYCDGGARGNPGPAASAFVVMNQSGDVLFSYGAYLGEATNNVAEYMAVLQAFEWLISQHICFSKIEFYLDSLLVVSQLNGVYKIKSDHLRVIIDKIKNYSKTINCLIEYTHIPRRENKLADKLVNQTLDDHLSISAD